jgi:hypothetical protein
MTAYDCGRKNREEDEVASGGFRAVGGLICRWHLWPPRRAARHSGFVPETDSAETKKAAITVVFLPQRGRSLRK